MQCYISRRMARAVSGMATLAKTDIQYFIAFMGGLADPWPVLA